MRQIKLDILAMLAATIMCSCAMNSVATYSAPGFTRAAIKNEKILVSNSGVVEFNDLTSEFGKRYAGRDVFLKYMQKSLISSIKSLDGAYVMTSSYDYDNGMSKPLVDSDGVLNMNFQKIAIKEGIKYVLLIDSVDARTSVDMQMNTMPGQMNLAAQSYSQLCNVSTYSTIWDVNTGKKMQDFKTITGLKYGVMTGEYFDSCINSNVGKIADFLVEKK